MSWDDDKSDSNYHVSCYGKKIRVFSTIMYHVMEKRKECLQLSCLISWKGDKYLNNVVSICVNNFVKGYYLQDCRKKIQTISRGQSLWDVGDPGKCFFLHFAKYKTPMICHTQVRHSPKMKFFTGGHWLSLTRHTRPFCLHVERVSPGCAEQVREYKDWLKFTRLET